ncbi:MAG TPA: MarR family transcriptional regulator [Ferruginibacter sp.]|nr:MarR family transcriptional regulator [Ferruginibacter sp.]HPH89987.1 MarR family transcriptional regulator [Ferruginibacter sp.]
MHCNELPETLGFKIVHTGKLLLKTINVIFAGISRDITFEQMGVLYYLSRNTGKKDMIQQDIAGLMDKNKSAVLRSIDILEQKGFVKRIPAAGDRRKNVIALTDEGKTIIERMHEFFLEQDVALKEGIEESELAICLKVLSKIQVKCRAGERLFAVS